MRRMDSSIFIQVHECKKQERGKVKIKKWLGIADLKRYEDFVWRWHTFLKNCEEGMKELDEQNAKVLTVVVLRNFYSNALSGRGRSTVLSGI